jgi:E1A/CREB-binding protein
MCKLSEQIISMKHDFIMVHLWYECSRCRKTIDGATRYYARTGEHYELCEECYGIEQSLPPEERGSRAELVPQAVPALPETKDADEQIECEFFDTRQAFLSMCQGNKFQFDTLRRAKHSSMMVTFHLHNPSEPAFVATCNLCARELEPGTGWRCETCPDFDVCDECRRYRGHNHELKPQAANRRDTSRAMSKEERQARMLQLQRTMELLVHASACQSQACQSSNCAKVKTLFQHAFTCQQKATGGCGLCRRMWTLLQVRAAPRAASCVLCAVRTVLLPLALLY